MTSAGRDADLWLVLDVDDTLVATYQTGFAKFLEVARSLRLEPPSEPAFAEIYGRLSFDECVQRLHPGADLARYRACYDSLATSFPPEPVCDGRSLLDAAARAGMRCGILTNGPAVKTARKLRACGLETSALGFVVCGDSAAVRKPHVASFAALSAHGVSPRMAWYVSDSAAEWRAAESAGFRSVGVCAGLPASRGFLPTLLLPSAGLLPEIVPALAESAGSPRAASPAAVTFDAGCTLIEPVEEAAAIVRRCLSQAGSMPSARAVRAAMAAAHGALAAPESWWTAPAAAEHALHRFYEETLANLGGRSAASARDIVSAYTSPTNWRAAPGAADLLAVVQASGRKVGVLSNWQPSLGEIFTATGLDRHVDVILPSTIVGAAKPSREAFHAAADALGTAVGRLVHVGDQLADDVLGALQAGCRAVFASGSLSDLADPFLSVAV